MKSNSPLCIFLHTYVTYIWDYKNWARIYLYNIFGMQYVLNTLLQFLTYIHMYIHRYVYIICMYVHTSRKKHPQNTKQNNWSFDIWMLKVNSIINCVKKYTAGWIAMQSETVAPCHPYFVCPSQAQLRTWFIVWHVAVTFSTTLWL